MSTSIGAKNTLDIIAISQNGGCVLVDDQTNSAGIYTVYSVSPSAITKKGSSAQR